MLSVFLHVHTKIWPVKFEQGEAGFWVQVLEGRLGRLNGSFFNPAVDELWSNHVCQTDYKVEYKGMILKFKYICLWALKCPYYAIFKVANIVLYVLKQDYMHQRSKNT